jgi:hypothetical protein
MAEHQAWHVEKYLDETDPFASASYFVMRGNVVIAQSEIEGHATQILELHTQHARYRAALEAIAGMASGDIDAAIGEAKRALDG